MIKKTYWAFVLLPLVFGPFMVQGVPARKECEGALRYLGKPDERFLALHDFAAGFYRRIDRAAHPDRIDRADVLESAAFYSDHGYYHLRDVRAKIFEVAQAIEAGNGRSKARKKFIIELALYLAELHDLAMGSPKLREIHAEVAGQLVFSGEFGPIADMLWNSEHSYVANHLKDLESSGWLKKPRRVFLELLSLSLAHRKSLIPSELLSVDRGGELRAKILQSLSYDFRQYSMELGFDFSSGIRNSYSDFESQAFSWMKEPRAKPFSKLLDDVIQAIRVVRVADALRQRGSALRTSGGHPVLLDARRGRAVVKIVRPKTGLTLYWESTDEYHFGESNIYASRIDHSKNIWIQIFSGTFPEETYAEMVRWTAFAIKDIYRDTILLSDSQELLISPPPDHPKFAKDVKAHLLAENPGYRLRIKKDGRIWKKGENRGKENLEIESRARSLDEQEKAEAIGFLKQTHPYVSQGELAALVQKFRVVELEPGEVYTVSPTEHRYVYSSLDRGLLLHPVGNYPSKFYRPGTVFGVGVQLIEGIFKWEIAENQSNERLRLVLIPGSSYLKTLYRPMSAEAVVRHLKRNRR